MSKVRKSVVNEKGGGGIRLRLPDGAPGTVEEVGTGDLPGGKKSALLASHAAQFDALVHHARTTGQVDEPAAAQAKADYLQVLGHIAQQAPDGALTHLENLKLQPWEGANDTVYHPEQHAIHVGDKALHGGYAKHTPRLSHMVIHQLAHALDYRDGRSVLGDELKGQWKEGDAWTPKRVQDAFQRPELFAPRLLEYALKNPAGFSHLATRVKRSQGLDLAGLLEKTLHVKVGEE